MLLCKWQDSTIAHPENHEGSLTMFIMNRSRGNANLLLKSRQESSYVPQGSQDALLDRVIELIDFVGSRDCESSELLQKKLQALGWIDKMLSKLQGGSYRLPDCLEANFLQARATYYWQACEFHEASWYVNLTLQKQPKQKNPQFQAVRLLKYLIDARLGFLKPTSALPDLEVTLDFPSILHLKAVRLDTQFFASRAQANADLQPMEGVHAAEHAWQLARIAIVRDGNPKKMLQNSLCKGPNRTVMHRAEAFLWMHVVKSRTWLKRVSPLLLQHLIREGGFSFVSARALWACTTALQQVYDTRIPLNIRLLKVNHALKLANQAPTLLYELLIVAALYRALARFSQRYLKAQVLQRYKLLSLRATSGRSDDVFDL